jgi:diguanylate cyclase (GGDEF)-like protein
MSDPVKRADRAEIARRVERAEKLLQKGKSADALEEYRQILIDDPENDPVRQMAADVCLALQRGAEATRLLGELFDRQVNAGDSTRASLTYKKLSRFVNPTWEQKVRFGLILENSNRKLALETYENALEEITLQGRKQDALSILKRIVALEASERNLLRVGELCSELGENREAAAAFLQLARRTEASGTNAANWFERAYSEDPSDSHIALCYSKSLMAQGQVGAAIFIIEPFVNTGGATLEFRDFYAEALLSADRLLEAEPYVWQLFEQNPSRINQVSSLIGSLLEEQLVGEAVALARKLDNFQRARGERRAFVATLQDLVAAHRTSAEMLEFMAEVFNSANREADYSQTLLKLFDLHYSTANYAKAAECFDRAAEVDPYEPGHQKRLEMLRGKIDEARFKVIASRFTTLNKPSAEPAKVDERTLGASTLQDLMLQAEILVQYGMRSKAIERLQRIQELFPREEERNEDLNRLYLTAGMTPVYAGREPAAAGSQPAATVATPPSQAPALPQNPPAAKRQAEPELSDVSSLTRVAEMTRKLYKQTTADAVLTVAVNEIGSQWASSRCLAAMRKPGLPPTAVREHRASAMAATDPATLVKLVAPLQELAVQRGVVAIADAQGAPELAEVRDALAQLACASLLALPLADGPDQMGLLALMQSTPRGWNASDIVVLKTICEQMVISLNNAGLRRLVKNLSVTDERSGLLTRASYLDLLLAEGRRASQQSTPLTVVLLQFGKSGSMVKEFGESAVQEMMQQVGHLLAANIRQNDLAFRYESTTVALVLSETAEREALMAVDKFRKVITELRLPGKDEPPGFAAGMAEAVIRQDYDAADSVTEVINRVELALDMAVAQGMGRTLSVPPQIASAAVA